MELRLLSGASERKAFEENLTRARTLKGGGFREKRCSRVAWVHLAFSDLYAVYDENGPEPDRMLAGFAIHNMAQFGPTLMRPDLSHLPPESVYEVGELWSLVKGNGLSLRAARALMTARAGCVLIPGLKGAQGLFVYAVTRRWDMTTVYPEFERFGPPIVAPYLETLEGGPVYLQPLVLQEHALAEVLSHRRAWRFQTNHDYSWVRIANPHGLVHVDMRPNAIHADNRPRVRSLERGADADSFRETFEGTESALAFARLRHQDEAANGVSAVS